MTTAPLAQREELAGLAVHEAAHAAAFAIGGIPFSHVELTPGGTVTAGAVMAHPGVPERPRAFVVALVAGGLAEHMLTGRSLAEIARTCAAQDMRRADEIAIGMGPDLVDALWRRAHRLVVQRADAIGQVAAALLIHRTLTEADVHQIVLSPQGARPCPSPTSRPKPQSPSS